MWPQMVDEIRHSPSIELRLIAIRRRVQTRTQTDEGRREVLRLASRRNSPISMDVSPLAVLLVQGWPRHPEVRRAALEAARPGFWSEDAPDLETAVDILIEGFSEDADAINSIAALIRSDHFSFVWRSKSERMLLRLAGNPTIISAFDDWMMRQKHIDAMSLSYAARFGWTALAKQKLLECLTSWIAFWAVDALLDHWGMADPEVAVSLRELVRSPLAADFGYVFPRIIGDRNDCYERLIALLRDRKCSRPESVLAGLIELNLPDRAGEILEAALPFTLGNSIRNWAVTNRLISAYAEMEPVRQLAKRELLARDGALAAVAESFGGDIDLRTEVIARATPLPSSMRSMLVTFLGENAANLPFSRELLRLYDSDENPDVKVQSAIYYYSLIAEESAVSQEEVDQLSATIVCYGPDHYERRQAAFCGLQIIGRLDLMLQAEETIGTGKPQVRLSAGIAPNLVFIRHILQNWESIKDTLGVCFWTCLSGDGEADIWAKFAILADEFPIPRAEALHYRLCAGIRRPSRKGSFLREGSLASLKG